MYYNDRSFKKGSKKADHDSFQTVLRKIKTKEQKQNNSIKQQIEVKKGIREMRFIDFKSFKEVGPVVTALWILALIAAIVGMVLLVLDMTGTITVVTWLPLSLCVVSLWINIFCLAKHRNKMYK